jgi:hypothetical protein
MLATRKSNLDIPFLKKKKNKENKDIPKNSYSCGVNLAL